MKKYSNNSVEMRTLYFTDGTAIFMFRGQTVETDKEVTYVPDGVRVKDIPEPTRKKRTSSTKKAEDDESPSQDQEG